MIFVGRSTIRDTYSTGPSTYMTSIPYAFLITKFGALVYFGLQLTEGDERETGIWVVHV
jgi:hypothetical protein